MYAMNLFISKQAPGTPEYNYAVCSLSLSLRIPLDPLILDLRLSVTVLRCVSLVLWLTKTQVPSKNNIKDTKISPADQEKFIRAESAQNNGFVSLGFFATAIVSVSLLSRLEV